MGYYGIGSKDPLSSVEKGSRVVKRDFVMGSTDLNTIKKKTVFVLTNTEGFGIVPPKPCRESDNQVILIPGYVWKVTKVESDASGKKRTIHCEVVSSYEFRAGGLLELIDKSDSKSNDDQGKSGDQGKPGD